MRDRSIDRWLEGARRVWAASTLARDHRTADVAPIWLQLREDDFGPQDTGDLNPFDCITSLPIAYRLGTSVRQQVTGGARLSGRLPMGNGPAVRDSVQFAELPAGASATLTYASGSCDGSWTAVADSSNVVPESNEDSNAKANLDEAPIC